MEAPGTARSSSKQQDDDENRRGSKSSEVQRMPSESMGRRPSERKGSKRHPSVAQKELQRVFENVKRVTIATENFSEADDPILMGSMMNSFPIFSAIAMPRVVPQLSHRCYSRSLESGMELVARGEKGPFMFFLLRGSLDMYIGDELVAVIGSGQPVGEAFMFGIEEVWPATLITREPTSVVFVRREELQKVVDRCGVEFKELPTAPLKECWAMASVEPGQFGDIGLFKDLAADTRHALESHSLSRVYFAGERILKEGEVGDELFVLLRGSVSVQSGGELVGTQDPSQSGGPVALGELGLLGLEEARSATVVAASACFCKVLKRAIFVKLLVESNESLNLRMMNELLYGCNLNINANVSDVNSIKLFEEAGCSQTFTDFLVGQLEERMFLKGQQLFEGYEGEPCMYVVQHGAVDVQLGGVTVKSLGRGDALGEANLLGVQVAQIGSMRAVAMEACFVRRLHRSAVLGALELRPADRAGVLAAALRVKEAFGEKSSGREGMRSAPFFEGMSRDLVDKLSQQALERVYMPGEVLFVEGSTGNSMHFLAFGQAGVWAKLPAPAPPHSSKGESAPQGQVSGSEGAPGKTTDGAMAMQRQMSGDKTWDKNACKQVASLGEGAVLGEMAMLGITPMRGATIEAQALLCSLELDQETCFGIIAEFPEAQRRFSAIVCERLEPTVQECVSSLSLWDPFDRNLPLFLGLSCERRIYFPGARIAKVSQPGDGMYIINRGDAKLETSGIRIKDLTRGGHFGTGVVLGLHTRNLCTMTTVTMCHFLFVTKDNFENAMTLYPSKHGLAELVRRENKSIKEMKRLIKRSGDKQFQMMKKKGDWLKQLLSGKGGKMDELLGMGGDVFGHHLLEMVVKEWRDAAAELRSKRLQAERLKSKRLEWIRHHQEAAAKRLEKDFDPESVALRVLTPPGRVAVPWDSRPAARHLPHLQLGPASARAKAHGLAPYAMDQLSGKRVTQRQTPRLPPASNSFLDRWRAMLDDDGG